MTRRVRQTSSRGFTLLELTLAMFIAMTLAGALYGAMYTAIHAKRSAEAAIRPARVLAIAGDLVSQDLKSVPPPNGILAAEFYGEQNNLDFYCIGADTSPRKQTAPMQEGVRHVQILLRTDLPSPSLVRRIERNLLTEVTRDPEEEMLCRNVKSFSVRYNDGTTWYDTWDSTAEDNTLPVLIEITISVDDGKGSTTSIVRMVTMPCTSAPTVDTVSTGGTAP